VIGKIHEEREKRVGGAGSRHSSKPQKRFRQRGTVCALAHASVNDERRKGEGGGKVAQGDGLLKN